MEFLHGICVNNDTNRTRHRLFVSRITSPEYRSHPINSETDAARDDQPSPDPARWLQDYGDYLYAYAIARLHERTLAEDAVQETLLAALRARTEYAGRAQEKTWLTGILKHKVVDCIRKQVRESTVEDIVALSDATGGEAIDSQFDARGRWVSKPRDWGSPEKALDNAQFMAAFEHCMARLKPALARVFQLRELTGRSNTEICNELEISATNCSVMLFRARMKLRHCIESLWSGNVQ